MDGVAPARDGAANASVGTTLGLDLDNAQVAFRRELRQWLTANHPGPEPDGEDEGFAFRREWQRQLYDAGYMGLTWPVEYGGRGLTPTEQAVFNTELVAARAPRPANLIGLEMGGPTIISHGRPDQKKRYLQRLLAGEEIWCQAFSEPQAGSDLVALNTRATLDGDEWVITGQKVWTSFAHEARWCMLLARSDPDSRGHAGLTCFLLDMQQTGVVVRRIDQITGDAEFNELFLDEARVPAADILGEPGRGWQIAVTTLMHERANLGFALAGDARLAFMELVDLVKHTPGAVGDPRVRDRLGQLAIETDILETTALRTLLGVVGGSVPGPESSLVKWRWAEVNQQINEVALDVLGTRTDRAWTKRYLRSRANSIEGGTTEILKNIVAERVLGLPKLK